MAIVGLVPLTAPASAATLYASRVGPVDHRTGYPFWYGDGTGLRLELCLDQEQDPLCPVVSDRQEPGAPLSVPENFPDESFWWAADAIIDDPAGVRARLVLAQEAAFGGTGEVAVGQQVAFSRLRVRIDDVTPGQSYHVTTPYGEDDFIADDRGRIFETNDQGCLMPPCDFAAGLDGQIGPFLVWDGGAPAGYVGDPNVEHTVTGSPTGDNLFRVEGPNVGGPGVNVIETDLFAVQGRFAQPRGTVDLPGDLYLTGTEVTLTSSFPGESTVYYSIGAATDPRTDGTEYTAPIPVPEGPMTLRYVVEYEGGFSEVYTEEYVGRSDLSAVSATPAPAVAPAVLEGRQDVELTATTTTVDPVTGALTETPTVGSIYYTTDGTRPRLDDSGNPAGTTRLYDAADPITITRTTLVRAFSLPDGDGAEAGPVSRFHYVIHNLRTVSTDQWWGYPSSLTDIGLPGPTPADDRVAPVELELCLDDPLCPVVGELPDPSRGISFPDNFPDESFWWSGEAEFDAAGGIRARLVLALEAAFDSATPQDGHQIAFGRIRVRIDDLVPDATYEIVHPYGVIRTQADDRGRLFYTDDTGCMVGPCGDFQRLLTQPAGPVLRWTEGAPVGYVGDPTAEEGHRVTGSPYGTNEFTVTQVADGNGNPVSVPLGSTDLFSVQGRLAGGPGVMASWQTGLFDHELDVTLTGTNTTSIHYTTDGTEPTVASPEYDGPIHIGEGVTTLSYVGVGPGGTSLVEAEEFTVDLTAPEVSASPASAALTAPQDVVLSANEPGATIRFTTDGTDPAAATAQTGPSPVTVRVAESLGLRALAVDPAGNVGPEQSFSFTVTPPPATGGTGTGTGGTPPADGAAATTGVTLTPTTAGPVNAGATTTLQGVLAPSGQVLAGVPVVLQAQALGTGARVLAAGWVDVATTTTAADGSYAFRVAPTRSVQYRAVYNGDATHTAAVSPTQRVKVKAVVRLVRPDRRVDRGDRFTLRGTIGPTMQGTTVVVKLNGPDRRHHRVRATVGRYGRWEVTLRAPRKTGRWTAKAVWRGDADLLRDASPTRRFRVTR